MHLSEVKNATAVGALIQVINWPHFAVEYLLDLALYTEDGKDVPRHESDLKVHNFFGSTWEAKAWGTVHF